MIKKLKTNSIKIFIVVINLSLVLAGVFVIKNKQQTNNTSSQATGSTGASLSNSGTASAQNLASRPPHTKTRTS